MVRYSRRLAALTAISSFPVWAAEMEVNIDNFSFTPKELTVKAGTAIAFRNRDHIPHSVVGAKGNALDTDDSFSFIFAKPGTYEYFCGLHPQIQGRSRRDAQGIINSTNHQFHVRSGTAVISCHFVILACLSKQCFFLGV